MTIPWHAVQSVLLDMDGTLLDRHFDDYFWETYVPQAYARARGLPPAQAKAELMERYRAEEGTLNWTDLDFWSEELGLDIPLLKTRVEHLIQVHPHVERFLGFLRERNKWICLATNAHGKTLDLKMRKTRLGRFFDAVVSAHDLGLPKEDPRFWDLLCRRYALDPQRSFLAEDSEANLRSARAAGVRYLVYVAKASTREPPRRSSEFLSIHHFDELLPGRGGA